MSIDKQTMTLDKLQNITYQAPEVFQLNYNGSFFSCEKMLRIVPEKRLVFMGKYHNENVIIKLFVHHSRAEKHWLRECKGAILLHSNNILSPEIMAQGISEEGVYFIIFQYIQGLSLAEFWKTTSQLKKEAKVKQMLLILEQHHNSGLAHQDLHYGNFFLSDKGDHIYTLDGEEVKASTSALTLNARIKNLALFLAQTFDLSQSFCLECFDDYFSLSSLDITIQERKEFWNKIKLIQQLRIDQYLKKILRECTEVIHDHKKGAYSLCRREYHNSAVQKLLIHPEQLFQDKASVYLKQGNTCTIKSILLDNQHYVIKRYNPKGLLYELTHIGQTSRARKSWINAHLLRFMGILTPEPVALIEQKLSMGNYYRYFISKQVTAPNSWSFFCEHPFIHHKNVADRLLSLFNKLAEYKITHGDLKGSNILIKQNKICILDLDGMQQHKKEQQFKKSWLRDKRRFLNYWAKKSCYTAWQKYFNQHLLSDEQACN